MASHPWVKGFPGSITVSDADGIILEMNDESVEAYREEGGAKLIGARLLDCHPPSSREKLKKIMDTKQSQAYTITKGGKQEFVYHTPWYEDGVYGGVLELIVEIPDNMPHYDRDAE